MRSLKYLIYLCSVSVGCMNCRLADSMHSIRIACDPRRSSGRRQYGNIPSVADLVKAVTDSVTAACSSCGAVTCLGGLEDFISLALSDSEGVLFAASSVSPVDVSVIEEYFSFYGTVSHIYILGRTYVIQMGSRFSVEQIFYSDTHDLSQGLVLSVFDPRSDCLSLNEALTLLEVVPPSCVFMIRKVNKLGFNGSNVAMNYFSAFGRVVKVVMLPLRSRKKNMPLPPKTGFVVMDCEYNVMNVLSQMHFVEGHLVSTGRFSQRQMMLYQDE